MIYIFALAIITDYNKIQQIETNSIHKYFLYDCYKKSSYYIDLLNLYIKNDDNNIQIKNIELLSVVNFIIEYQNKFDELF